MGSGTNFFESIEDVKAILPNDMNGAEIKQKYNIWFHIDTLFVESAQL